MVEAPRLERPKGSRDKPKAARGLDPGAGAEKLEGIILDEAYREVTVRENG